MGSDGFLVQPENSTLLAEALNKALELTKQQSNKVGEAARQRIVENFSLDANVATYLKLYTKT
jgi:glycosyltransferase involved in cell wall biosynthesis